MKPGQASQTAVLVCMGRAIAHGTTQEPRFSDPTALALLPDTARARIEAARAGAVPRDGRARMRRAYIVRLAKVMVARTVAIDDAIRAAAAPQLVILGAGLDGRAWRMPELANATVFEVDHPDSQREKRVRIGGLAQSAKDVRFVPVDFTRDDLDQALTAAGHDPARPTTWNWEGVVMYLTLPEIEATLATIQRQSAVGSRLIVTYHAPAFWLHFVGMVVRRFGEPLRSAFTHERMRALLGRYGFGVVSDDDLAAIGARLAPDVAEATRRIGHLRIAVADRPSTR